MTRKEKFIEEIKEEIVYLRNNLNDEQKSKLDTKDYIALSIYNSTYGLIFGDDYSDEAVAFMPKKYDDCCNLEYSHKYPDLNNSFEIQSFTEGDMFTAFEKYEVIVNGKGIEDIFEYIKGNKDDFEILDERPNKYYGVMLFLDDTRDPIEAYEYTKYEIFKLNHSWHIVRSIEEFKQWIKNNGLPDLISFDHDLLPEHYTPEEYWGDYHASKIYQESFAHKDTGLCCAKWLTLYCEQYSLELPKWLVHSANPIGRDKITHHLMSFNN